MKRILLIALCGGAGAMPLLAADLRISLSIGEPGYHGQLELASANGNFVRF